MAANKNKSTTTTKSSVFGTLGDALLAQRASKGASRESLSRAVDVAVLAYCRAPSAANAFAVACAVARAAGASSPVGFALKGWEIFPTGEGRFGIRRTA